ncbi:243_t:CDS:1, partial [Acaulospora morrowiae]
MPGKSGIYLGVPELSNPTSSISKKPRYSRSLSPHYKPRRENPTRKVVDGLLELFYEERRKCTPIDEIKEILESSIVYDYNDNSEHIYRWLFKYQSTLNYKCLFGFFLLLGIGCDQDPNEAYRQFINPAKKNYPVDQILVGDCYMNGW